MVACPGQPAVRTIGAMRQGGITSVIGNTGDLE
jgi:hypothetical protein